MSRWLEAGDKEGMEALFLCKITGTRCGSLDTGSDYVEMFVEEVNGAGIQTKKLWLTENGWESAEKTLKELGWDPEEHAYAFEELDTGTKSPMVGILCEAVVVAEAKRSGEGVWNEVAFLNKPKGPDSIERMDPEEAKGFGDSVRRKLRLSAAARKQRIKKAAGEGTERQRGNMAPARARTPSDTSPVPDPLAADDCPF